MMKQMEVLPGAQRLRRSSLGNELKRTDAAFSSEVEGRVRG